MLCTNLVRKVRTAATAAIALITMTAATLNAQQTVIANATPTGTTPTATVAPVDKTLTLGPGQSVTDGTRTVTNGGTKGNLKIKYSGKSKRSGDEFKVGEIKIVTNPRGAGGTLGPVTVNTGGAATRIDNRKNGIDGVPKKPVVLTVNGGNATVNMNGHHGRATVGGTNNTVNMNGNHNTGNGADNNSSGNVRFGSGSRGNSWGGTGNWRVGN